MTTLEQASAAGVYPHKARPSEPASRQESTMLATAAVLGARHPRLACPPPHLACPPAASHPLACPPAASLDPDSPEGMLAAFAAFDQATSSSTSLLTSDDTWEAHSFLESDQLLTQYIPLIRTRRPCWPRPLRSISTRRSTLRSTLHSMTCEWGSEGVRE